MSKKQKLTVEHSFDGKGYIILQTNTADSMQRIINEKIAGGFMPYGELTVLVEDGTLVMFQPMMFDPEAARAYAVMIGEHRDAG